MLPSHKPRVHNILFRREISYRRSSGSLATLHSCGDGKTQTAEHGEDLKNPMQRVHRSTRYDLNPLFFSMHSRFTKFPGRMELSTLLADASCTGVFRPCLSTPERSGNLRSPVDGDRASIDSIRCTLACPMHYRDRSPGQV